jgi:hypothetical protein
MPDDGEPARIRIRGWQADWLRLAHPGLLRRSRTGEWARTHDAWATSASREWTPQRR